MQRAAAIANDNKKHCNLTTIKSHFKIELIWIIFKNPNSTIQFLVYMFSPNKKSIKQN